MAKKKLPYWIQRAIDEEELVQRALDVTERKILNAHLKGQKYLEDQIAKIYNRYLNRSELNESDVKKILNTSAKVEDLQELQLMARTIEDKEIRKQVRDYLTGLSVKYRISVLEDLKAKSYIVAKQIADVELNASTDFYIDVIKRAHEQASAEAIIGKTEQAIVPVINPNQYVSYRNGNVIQLKKLDTDEVVRSIKVTPDMEIPEFKELSTKYVKNILETNWKGSNYSKRIWNDTDALAEKLEELFTVKQMTGMSDNEMVKQLQSQFQVSAGVARRLIRTESNYVANQAKLKGWKEHGVEKYMIVAVLDLRTSKICQHMDGKVFKVADANVLENYPPFHPFVAPSLLLTSVIALFQVVEMLMTLLQGRHLKFLSGLITKSGKKLL